MCGEGELQAEAFSLGVKSTSSHVLRVDLLSAPRRFASNSTGEGLPQGRSGSAPTPGQQQPVDIGSITRLVDRRFHRYDPTRLLPTPAAT